MKLIQDFVVHGTLPGTNQIYKTSCWQASHKVKMEFEDHVIRCAQAQNVKPLTEFPVTFCFEIVQSDRRRDSDNTKNGAPKIILDALQRMGVLPNDSQGYVKDTLFFPLQTDKEHPRIHVFIYDKHTIFNLVPILGGKQNDSHNHDV